MNKNRGVGGGEGRRKTRRRRWDPRHPRRPYRRHRHRDDRGGGYTVSRRRADREAALYRHRPPRPMTVAATLPPRSPPGPPVRSPVGRATSTPAGGTHPGGGTYARRFRRTPPTPHTVPRTGSRSVRFPAYRVGRPSFCLAPSCRRRRRLRPLPRSPHTHTRARTPAFSSSSFGDFFPCRRQCRDRIYFFIQISQ